MKIYDFNLSMLCKDSRETQNNNQSLLSAKKRFMLETRNICSMFSREFYQKYDKDKYDFKRIYVICCDSDNRNDTCEIVLGNVLNVYLKFNCFDFFEKTNVQKKTDALALLMRGLKTASKSVGFDMTPFLAIEESIIKQNYQNNWLWNKKKSPSKKIQAQILCEHDVYKMDIYMVIVDAKDLELQKNLIVSTGPDEWDYHEYLGKLKWVSKNEAVLYGKGSKAEFEYSCRIE